MWISTIIFSSRTLLTSHTGQGIAFPKSCKAWVSNLLFRGQDTWSKPTSESTPTLKRAPVELVSLGWVGGKPLPPQPRLPIGMALTSPVLLLRGSRSLASHQGLRGPLLRHVGPWHQRLEIFGPPRLSMGTFRTNTKKFFPAKMAQAHWQRTDNCWAIPTTRTPTRDCRRGQSSKLSSRVNNAGAGNALWEATRVQPVNTPHRGFMVFAYKRRVRQRLLWTGRTDT